MKTIFILLMVAFAWCASAVSLRVGTVRGFPGNTVEVPVSLRYASNEARDVVALQADVLFDASGASAGAPIGSAALTGHVLASSQPASGVRRLLVYSLNNAALTNAHVVSIPFTVAPGQYRNFSLTLTNVILARADASQVFATNVNGFIAVSQVYVAPDGHADGFLNVTSNEVEQCYVVRATSDFVNWVNVQTNSAFGALLEFQDSGAGSHPHRFYQAVLCEALAGVRIGGLERLAGGNLQFEFTGLSGLRYVVQASTNLTQWEDLRTFVGESVNRFTESSPANHAHRFYRIVTRP